MTEFPAQTYLDLLGKILESPPSDRQLDTGVVNMIRRFMASEDHGPVAVWNFYKQVLDVLVHDSAGSGFFLKLFDLEASYKGPEGSFRQMDHSIDRAPWRQAGAPTAAPWA